LNIALSEWKWLLENPDTTEKDGFAHLNEQLRQIPAYQFQVSSNEHGRIHGLVIGNIFFIIWLDPDHRLYV
jgi:hypothetical protein